MSLPGSRETVASALSLDFEAELERVEALSDLLALFLAYYKLAPNTEEREYAKSAIWGLITKWVEQLGPVKHVPGLVEELANGINTKLWDSSELELDEVKRVITTTYVLKKLAESNTLVEGVEEYGTLVGKLLAALGCSSSGVLVEEIINTRNPENLVALTTLVLVLATNP